ncbi:hypothetical protein INS49_004571 [Diaporthe citri]|uniref:uncharacterized protein n=1 Tax=Diaporthe citri TaxID=83186 RepID=UPI001C7E613A|nr:uncharacterized protein INS49_004571 [Diaporthe citri]KAG6354554.1 hypothetical protein INS49_004571 [Diaporthe citri]
MPQAGRTTGPHLDIHLDSTGRPYQPGDVITGRVVRRAHAVSPQASVTIQLLGRAKSKIVVTRHNGNNTTHSYYRSRYNFFDAGYMQTRQYLHQGPIHVPSSAEPVSWEFAIEIPTRPSPRAVVSEMKDPEACYLPLNAGNVADYPLPASFANSGRRGSTRFDAYVEYHLEATLVQQGGSSRHGDTITATLPIRIRAPPMPYPLTDFDLRRRSAQFAASSYRLVPGMETVELSFKQKSKKFFGSSKVPMFGFTLQYDAPAVIQLDNPAPVPFRVRVVPDGRRTSEVLQGVPQVVTLGSLELVLKADTCVIAPGTFSKHTGDDTVKHNIHLPVAFAGDVPAAVLRTADRGVKGEEPAGGKEAANAGAVHRPGTTDGKQRIESPGEEQGESSASRSTQPPAPASKEERVVEQVPTPTPEMGYQPAAEWSSPPTYQPNTSNESPPPAPPASEQPPAYQLPKDLSRRGPLVIPSAWGADGPWLDVGEAIGLRLHETHATALARSVAGTVADPICPGFTTYCIMHSHRLKWKMAVAVGGETEKQAWMRGEIEEIWEMFRPINYVLTFTEIFVPLVIEGPDGGVTTRNTWCLLKKPQLAIVEEQDLETGIPDVKSSDA